MIYFYITILIILLANFTFDASKVITKTSFENSVVTLTCGSENSETIWFLFNSEYSCVDIKLIFNNSVYTINKNILTLKNIDATFNGFFICGSLFSASFKTISIYLIIVES